MADAYDEDWTDGEMSRVLALGAAIGIPLMFVIATLLSVVGDQSFWRSMAIAALPSAFVGPYIGGLFAMGATSSHHDHAVAGAAERPIAA